jgi:hypothetical protein
MDLRLSPYFYFYGCVSLYFNGCGLVGFWLTHPQSVHLMLNHGKRGETQNIHINQPSIPFHF